MDNNGTGDYFMVVDVMADQSAEPENIVEFAPFGWAVYELSCVNCQHRWVCVAPYRVTDLHECPCCGKNKDIYQPDFKAKG
jgi:hypothetical protein